VHPERKSPHLRSFDPGGALKTGATLVRQWRGHTHTVLVREDGFEYEGHRYRSLTVIAERITGTHWSGPWPLVLSRVHWVRPELVAEVKYLTWTDDNLLWQVVYEGMREDNRRRSPAAEAASQERPGRTVAPPPPKTHDTAQLNPAAQQARAGLIQAPRQ
jgi:ATP-dependent DNA ligase